MIRYFLSFLACLMILTACGGGGSHTEELHELSLNTGTDPIQKPKSLKPSTELLTDAENLLANLKKQHYQTEVALVALPEAEDFIPLENWASRHDSGSANTGGGSSSPSPTSPTISTTNSAKKSKEDLSALMSSIEINGSLSSYSVSSINRNQIIFSPSSIYYFRRPVSMTEFDVFFLKITDTNKEIEKIFSDNRELVFHIYADKRILGLTAPNGKKIQILIKDISNNQTETLDLIFDEKTPSRGSPDGVTSTLGGGTNTLDSSHSAPTSTEANSSQNTDKSVNFTDTNNAVEGVSETDHVKTDGSYIYNLAYNKLSIYNVALEQTISSLTLNFDNLGFEEYLRDTQKQDLIASEMVAIAPYVYSEINLLNNTLIIFSQFADKTLITFVDINHKEAPIVTQQLLFREGLVTGRITNDKIVLILNDYLYPTKEIKIPYHYAFTAEQQEAFSKANERLIQDVTLADFGLDKSFDKIVGKNKETISYLEDNRIYFDASSGGYAITKVLVLNTNAEILTAAGVLTDYTENVYVNTDAIVLYNTTWQSRIQWWDFEWANAEKTMLYYFKLTGAQLDFVDGIEVSGRPQGIFSFHQSGSNLFMAFHESETNSNGIHTIGITNSELTLTNTLTNIAPEENLQSVRFIGNRAYLVTFKSVDPLFAIDLTNPNQPIVLGELKTTGFSSYLHLVLSDVLLGVGYEATEEGRITGAKVTTFDVSKHAPEEIDQANLMGGYSSFNASYDHHAFTWYPSHKLLALPYFSNNPGVIVYRFNDAGQIIDAALLDKIENNTSRTYYSSFSSRVIFIEDTLYYIDGEQVKPYPITELEFSADHKNVDLSSEIIGPVEPIIPIIKVENF